MPSIKMASIKLVTVPATIILALTVIVLFLSNNAIAARTTPPPTEPYEGTADFYLCNNLCFAARDGICDDGGPGSRHAICPYGSDCADCTNMIPRPPYTRAPTAPRRTPSPTRMWVPDSEEPVQTTPPTQMTRTSAPVTSGGFESTPFPTTSFPTSSSPSRSPVRRVTRRPTPRRRANRGRKNKRLRVLDGVEVENDDDDYKDGGDAQEDVNELD